VTICRPRQRGRATDKTVCDECKFIREERRIKKFYRPPRDHPRLDQNAFLTRASCVPVRRHGADVVSMHEGGHALPRLLRPATRTLSIRARTCWRRPLRCAGPLTQTGERGPHRRSDCGRGGYLLPLRLPASFLHRSREALDAKRSALIPSSPGRPRQDRHFLDEEGNVAMLTSSFRSCAAFEKFAEGRR